MQSMHFDTLSLAPPNLPVLYEAETLYSWCGQVHLWNGNASVLLTNRQLFKSKYSGLLHDFPANLGTLNKQTLGLLPSPEVLAIKHTLLGYYLPFHEKSASLEVLDGVIKGSLPQLKYLLGIPASRIGGDHPLKLCSECIEENLTEHGRPMWQVSHQTPSSFVCIKHKKPLDIVLMNNTPVHQRYWADPTLGLKTQAIDIKSDLSFERLIKLKEFSTSVYSMSPGAFDSQILARTYQSRFKDEGLLTTRGNIKIQTVCASVIDYYKDAVDLPGFQILDSLHNSANGFVGAITRKQPKKAHPFKHLLLMSMLFESWDDFIERYKNIKENTPEWIAPPIVEKIAPDPRITLFISLVKDDGLSIRIAAKKIGVSITTGTQWAKLHKIFFTPRTKTLTPNKLNIVKERLINGWLKKDIVQSSEISLVSLNRFLLADIELKEKWLEARLKLEKQIYRKKFLNLTKTNPGLPVKLIRKIPGNGYQWLYRHDRSWLIDNLPSLWNIKS